MFTRAHDVMTPAPTTVPSSALVADAHHALQRHGYRHLPVVDQGRLVGMLSEHDLQRALQALEAAQDVGTTVGHWMTTDVITVDSDTPIEEVVRVLYQAPFHAVPVLKNGDLDGILTTTDLMRELLHHAPALAPQPTEHLESTLDARIADLTRRVDALRRHLRKQDGRREQRGDADSYAQFDEVMEALETTAAAELDRLTEAKRRLAAGTYGTCTQCGDAIAPARLIAAPAVQLCIECARAFE